MKKLDLFLAIGQISLVLGLLGYALNLFVFDHLPVLSFFTGLFMGLSLVMNLAFSIMRKSKT